MPDPTSISHVFPGVGMLLVSLCQIDLLLLTVRLVLLKNRTESMKPSNKKLFNTCSCLDHSSGSWSSSLCPNAAFGLRSMTGDRALSLLKVRHVGVCRRSSGFSQESGPSLRLSRVIIAIPSCRGHPRRRWWSGLRARKRFCARRAWALPQRGVTSTNLFEILKSLNLLITSEFNA